VQTIQHGASPGSQVCILCPASTSGKARHRHRPEGRSAVPAASPTEALAWTFAVITIAMAVGNALGVVIIQGLSPQAVFPSPKPLGLAGPSYRTHRLLARQRQPGPSCP